MTSKCPKCPFLIIPEELDEHMSIHRSKRPSFTSQLTTAILKDKENANAKTSSEKEGEPRIEKEKKKCNICEKQLALSSVSRHMKDKHGESHKCSICKKICQTISSLESHQSKAHVVKTISYFECDFCDYKSMNKYFMTDHVKRQHAGAGSNSFVCNQCYTRKQNEYLLKKHMQQHVQSNCVACQKTFNSSKNLKRHGKVHEIQRCEECGKNYNSKKDLRVHKQVHKKKKTKQINEEDQIDNLDGAEFVYIDNMDMDMDNLRELGNETLALL